MIDVLDVRVMLTKKVVHWEQIQESRATAYLDTLDLHAIY